MYTSAELIEALRRRLRRSLRPEAPPGEFPPGWQAWFDGMRTRVDAVTGATAAAILEIFLAREPKAPPAAVGQLGRWQAVATLWRQDWHPASEDERWTRIAAGSGSLFLHVLFALVLGWLLYAGFFIDTAPEPDRKRGEDVTQVEFIGEGTPDASGGGEATPQPEDVPAQASATPAPAERPAPVEPAEATPPPVPAPPEDIAAAPAEAPTPPVPEPQPVPDPVPEPQPVPPQETDLVVTEVPVPDTTFVVPPATVSEATRDAPRTPREVAVREREITVTPQRRFDVPATDVPRPAPPSTARPVRDVAAREREIPAPRAIEAPRLERQPSSIEAPRRAVAERAVTGREVPMPSAPAPSTQAGSAAAAAAVADSAASTANATPSPASGTTGSVSAPAPRTAGNRSPAASPGSGATAGLPPGAPPGTRRSDDWGESTREVAGGERGRGGTSLFDGDGRPRLADGDGAVGGGLPPGTITEDFEKIDRMGTWLKRPPIGYEPTAFDRYWVPSETLLQEWVRRSIKEVLVPIPGTSKKIRCTIVALMAGGACGITDPNMQDIETDGRPPPDVPFKRELQEDQQAVGTPPGG